jgi:hypothetical protein
MLDLNEIRLVLIVGLHTVVNALAVGEMQKAIYYTFSAISCYFIILGCVWVSQRFFSLTDSANTVQPKKIRRSSQNRGNKVPAIKTPKSIRTPAHKNKSNKS